MLLTAYADQLYAQPQSPSRERSPDVADFFCPWLRISSVTTRKRIFSLTGIVMGSISPPPVVVAPRLQAAPSHLVCSRRARSKLSHARRCIS